MINKCMNYKMHYDRLIERARERAVDGYTEQHHVLPRCLGGDDSPENLVRLTPEEHYVAHQLLVKLYPKNQKLIYAALMMTVCSKKNIRNNKLYGWIKRKYQQVAQQRIGKKNGSFGKPWYHNPETLEAGKFMPGDEPAGWNKGRCPTKQSICHVCRKHTGSSQAKYCKEHREKITKGYIKERISNGYRGREKELKTHLQQGKSIHRSLKEMGYSGNNGPLSVWAKQVLLSIAESSNGQDNSL